MRTLIIAILLTALCGMTPAYGSEYEDMDINLGKAVVARAICKDPSEVSYVSKVRKNIYLFAVFYAKQEARFVVGVSDKMIRLQGREFLKLTNTIPYTFDTSAKCAVVQFSSPECPVSEPLVVCSEKTPEEKLDETFWGRPVPDLLDEDLREALERYKTEGQTAPQEGDAAQDGGQPQQ